MCVGRYYIIWFTKIILILCQLIAKERQRDVNVTKRRFLVEAMCGSSSGQSTFRYRSLLKLNCIINASRTISDGLYGNLRPRERPWKFEKGLTNQPTNQPSPPPFYPNSPLTFYLSFSSLSLQSFSLLCLSCRPRDLYN